MLRGCLIFHVAYCTVPVPSAFVSTVSHRSLGLLLLYHFHNHPEGCRPHRRSVLLPLTLALHRQTRQHHLSMLVPLCPTHRPFPLSVVVVKRTPQAVDPALLPSSGREPCRVAIWVHLAHHLPRVMLLHAHCRVRPKLIGTTHHARLRRVLIALAIGSPCSSAGSNTGSTVAPARAATG